MLSEKALYTHTQMKQWNDCILSMIVYTSMQQAIKFLQFKNGKFWKMAWKKWNFDFLFYVFL